VLCLAQVMQVTHQHRLVRLQKARRWETLQGVSLINLLTWRYHVRVNSSLRKWIPAVTLITNMEA
jgi:iron-sulfur cluster repair protein YtfE (RIC family)